MPKVKTLPPRMHLKHGAYYHVSTTQPRKWTRLSEQLGEALNVWASIEASPLPASNTTFAGMANLYRLQVIPTLRDKTQIDYHRHLDRLTPVFEHLQLAHIKPSDVHQYCQLRGKTSKVQANREKAILSALFNFARRNGYIDCPNPCAGVKGHTEKPRVRYVTDEEFFKVYDVSKWFIQDAMDLALLLGQRPADVLKIQLQDIQADYVSILQNKTGAKLRIERTGELAAVITRVLARDRLSNDSQSQLLVCLSGKPLNATIFRKAFEQARELAGVHFQFRDLRAKAATDTNDLPWAQKLLGHRLRNTTETYTRDRLGATVKPLR
jgi:integrase